MVTMAEPVGVVPPVPLPEARSRLLMTARLPVPNPTVSASDVPSSTKSSCAATRNVAVCTVFVS